MNTYDQTDEMAFRSARGMGVAPTPQQDDETDIDLRAIGLKIWRGKWIIAICTLIAGLIGFLLISQIEPRYITSAKVMFNLSQSNVVDIDEVVVRSSGQNSLQNELEVLRSTTLIERVIERLRLSENPEFNPLLRAPKETVMSRLRSNVTLPEGVRDTLRDIGVLSPPPAPPNPEKIAEWERLR